MSIKSAAKEWVRHTITRTGLAGVQVRFRKMKGQNVGHLLEPSLAGRFSAIYRNKVWLNDRAMGSLSGEGSDLGATQPVIERLPWLLKSIGTHLLLDIGCGDFNWMKEIELGCSYLGVDIVPEVIETNTRSWSSPQRSFRVMDATCDPLPPADTALCREVLFHLSFDDAWRVIENVRASGVTFLIATNDSGLPLNADIISGDFRIINLHRSPFFFPAPAASIPDDRVSRDRVLGVWQISDVPPRRR